MSKKHEHEEEAKAPEAPVTVSQMTDKEYAEQQAKEHAPWRGAEVPLGSNDPAVLPPSVVANNRTPADSRQDSKDRQADVDKNAKK